MAQPGVPDFYAYQAETNPIKAFDELVQTVAEQPKIEAARQEAERKRNMELEKIYTPETPDFTFRWQEEQQKALDDINDIGHKLTVMRYDPYKSGALTNDKAAQLYKDFHTKSNLLKQTNSAAKYLQGTWDTLTKSIREHPDKYNEDALAKVNEFYNRPLSEIMKEGKPAPDITQLEKPYNFTAWASKTKNAIDPTQNGYILQRSPGAIENHFLAEYQNNPQAKQYWAKTFSALPEDERKQYAARAIKEDTAPEYLYGLDVAKESLIGRKNKPKPASIIWPWYTRLQGNTSQSSSPYSVAAIDPSKSKDVTFRTGKNTGTIPGFNETPVTINQNVDLSSGYYDLDHGGTKGRQTASGSVSFKASQIKDVPVDSQGNPISKEKYLSLPNGTKVDYIPMLIGTAKIRDRDVNVMIPASQLSVNKTTTKSMQQTLKAHSKGGGSAFSTSKKENPKPKTKLTKGGLNDL